MVQRLLLLGLLLLVSAAPATAQASGANDESVRELIRNIFESEVAAGKYTEALSNLEVAHVVCEGDACSKEARAELWLSIGRVQSRLKRTFDAEKSFNKALKIFPGATLPSGAQAQARKSFVKVSDRRAKKRSQGCQGTYQGARPPRGWRKGIAYHCLREAKRHQRRFEWKPCAIAARASFDLEQRVQTQALLARCLDKSKQWTEAIANYENVSRKGPSRGLFSLSRRSRNRATQLRRLMPAIVLQAPTDVRNLVVKLDGTILPNEILGQEIPLDPGGHLIEARGNSDGIELSFEQGVSLSPRKTLTVLVSLAPGPPKWATRSELRCLTKAKTADAFSECLGRRVTQAGDINKSISTEVSVYHDSMNVDVVAPAVGTRIEHVTEGWGLGANLIVDVVTAASTDIVSTASYGFRETRWAPSINGHKRFGDVDIAVSGSLSHEPDYISSSVGARGAWDLRQKTVTPSLGYQFSYDINGKEGTDFDVFSHKIHRHSIDLGLGLIMSKATFGQIAATFQLERGDTSKPYRHIPIFDPSQVVEAGCDPAVVTCVTPGASEERVNQARLAMRPLEQLPLKRTRYAIAMSVAHRFRGSTLRASERLYTDSWGVFASTTNLRYIVDANKWLRLGPHLRFHAQNGARFYKLAYWLSEDGSIHKHRTGDRELGPLLGAWAGGSGRIALGAGQNIGLRLSASAVYTRFLNHLFVKNRWAFFGSTGVEVDLQ